MYVYHIYFYVYVKNYIYRGRDINMYIYIICTYILGIVCTSIYIGNCLQLFAPIYMYIYIGNCLHLINMYIYKYVHIYWELFAPPNAILEGWRFAAAIVFFLKAMIHFVAAVVHLFGIRHSFCEHRFAFVSSKDISQDACRHLYSYTYKLLTACTMAIDLRE